MPYTMMEGNTAMSIGHLLMIIIYIQIETGYIVLFTFLPALWLLT